MYSSRCRTEFRRGRTPPLRSTPSTPRPRRATAARATVTSRWRRATAEAPTPPSPRWPTAGRPRRRPAPSLGRRRPTAAAVASVGNHGGAGGRAAAPCLPPARPSSAPASAWSASAGRCTPTGREPRTGSSSSSSNPPRGRSTVPGWRNDFGRTERFRSCSTSCHRRKYRVRRRAGGISVRRRRRRRPPCHLPRPLCPPPPLPRPRTRHRHPFVVRLNTFTFRASIVLSAEGANEHVARSRAHRMRSENHVSLFCHVTPTLSAAVSLHRNTSSSCDRRSMPR